MAISGTSTNYSDRLVDMYISGPLNPLSTAVQSINYSFGKPSQYIAGVQKLIQRYLISLMNTGVVTQLMGSTASNISNATAIFTTNNWTVIQAFWAYQNNNLNTPLDEQLSTVQLLNTASDGDTLSFSLQLITNAGTTVVFTLPLPLD